MTQTKSAIVVLKLACLSVFLFALSSCGEHIVHVDRVFLKRSGDGTSITVHVDPSVLEYVKKKQIYLTVDVVECTNKGTPFSSEAYVASKRLVDFDYDARESGGLVTAVVPTKILDGFDHPCVRLYGAGYFTRKIVSNTVPLSARVRG